MKMKKSRSNFRNRLYPLTIIATTWVSHSTQKRRRSSGPLFDFMDQPPG